MSTHFQESRETVRDFFLEGAKRLFARKGNGKLELGRYRITSPCDGMVDITDLKSVADMACEFESRWGHQHKGESNDRRNQPAIKHCDPNNDHGSRQLHRKHIHMTRRRKEPIDCKEYLRIRIDSLTVERTKNNDPTTHMILDKAITELSIVLDLLERKAPL